MTIASDVAEDRSLGLVRLSILAVIIGLVTGFGAVFFRALIALVHNFFFLGSLSVAYDANLFTPAGPWGRGSSWGRSSAE